MEKTVVKKTEDKGPDKDADRNIKKQKQMEELRILIEQDAPNREKGYDRPRRGQTRGPGTQQTKHREPGKTIPRNKNNRSEGADKVKETHTSDNEESRIKAVKLRAKGSEVTWKKEYLVEKIQEQNGIEKNTTPSIEPIGSTEENNRGSQNNTRWIMIIIATAIFTEITKRIQNPTQKNPKDKMTTTAISSINESQHDVTEHPAPTPGPDPYTQTATSKTKPVWSGLTTYETHRVTQESNTCEFGIQDEHAPEMAAAGTRDVIQQDPDTAPTPTPGYLAGAPVDPLTLHRMSRIFQLHGCPRPHPFPEMDSDRIIHGYTYRPIYRGPHGWHCHANYFTRLAPNVISGEAMLFLSATVIAPLILCMVVGLGLVATNIYQHILARMADNGGHSKEQNKDSPPHDNTSNKAPPDTTGRDDPFPDEVHPLNNTPARARWDENSADTLRSLLYRTTSQQDHGDVRLIPPRVDLRTVADHTTAPSLPTSRKVHPSADVDTSTQGTGLTMKQVLDEIKHLRVARSSIKGEMVKLIHRLAELEEETLRSELRAIIRAERAAGPHDGARTAPDTKQIYA